MKIKLLLSMLGILATGCIGLPENAKEHDENVVFRHRLVSDVRVAAILTHKPNQDIYVDGDSRVLIISVNVPEVVSFGRDLREIVGPGNMYTPVELTVIENASLDIRAELGIERNILVYDATTKREHKAQRTHVAEVPTSTPTNAVQHR